MIKALKVSSFLILFSAVLFHVHAGEKVNIVFSTHTGRKKVLKIDSDIKTWKVYKDDFIYFGEKEITNVKGLAQLKKLKAIIFFVPSVFADFQFLTQAPSIEVVGIYTTDPVDLSFIHGLPNLKTLSLSEIFNFNIRSIDLKDNPKLKYLGITASGLKQFPKLLHIPKTLTYYSLEANSIKALPFDKNGKLYPSIKYIFLYENPASDMMENHDNLYATSMETNVLSKTVYNDLYDLNN